MPLGNTPQTVTPQVSQNTQTVSFNNGAYLVTIDQTSNGAHTIFYDSVADSGKVAMTGAQSSVRGVASNQSFGTLQVRRLQSFAHSNPIVPDAFYVKYDSSKLSASHTIQGIEGQAGVGTAYDLFSSVAAVRGRVARVTPGTDMRSVAARVSSDPAVVGVYPLHYRVAEGATYQAPNDPEFPTCDSANTTGNPCQWSFNTIDAPYAWFYTDGSKAKIAIIDTGVDDSNPDLPYGSKVVYEENDVGAGGATPQPTGAGAATDYNGHGTNVSGIAAAATNNKQGFAGVGDSALLYAFAIFPQQNSAGANTADEAFAIASAVKQGVDVINLSLGSAQYDPSAGAGWDQAEHDAVEAAIAAGVSVVAAAGNGDETTGYSTLDYPAGYDGVISVGATGLNDNGSGTITQSTYESVSQYSNYGPGLAVVAPGGNGNGESDVLHYIVNDTSSHDTQTPCTYTPPGVCAAKFVGTSQATPHVSGTIALVQSALRQAGKTPLNPAQMFDADRRDRRQHQRCASRSWPGQRAAGRGGRARYPTEPEPRALVTGAVRRVRVYELRRDERCALDRGRLLHARRPGQREWDLPDRRSEPVGHDELQASGCGSIPTVTARSMRATSSVLRARRVRRPSSARSGRSPSRLLRRRPSRCPKRGLRSRWPA